MQSRLVETHHTFHVLCFENRPALIAHLADELRNELQAITDNGPRVVLLSGGSTPFPAYNSLAEDGPNVSDQVHLAFADDRYVAQDHDKSNYHGTRPLIDALGLPAHRVHAIDPTLNLDDCAREYHARLAALVEQQVAWPFGVLGLGADGHTAGLFTRSDLERDTDLLATWVHRPDGLRGVTVTPKLLGHVQRLAFVIAGNEKKEQLANLLKRPHRVIAGQAVQGHPNVEVWCDADAWPG